MEKPIKIDKGIPLIPKRTNNKYPLAEMEVGDSFLHPEEYSRELMGRVSNSVKWWGHNQTPKKKFAIRKTDEGGIRVWRTE